MVEIISQKLDVNHYRGIYAALSLGVFNHLKSPPPKNEDEEKRYIEKLVMRMQTSHDEYYVYRYSRNLEVVGFGGIHVRDETAEIQLWVKEKEWGKGIGRFIIKDLINRCRKVHKTPIIACFKTNSRALNLFERIGFTKIKSREQIINLFGNFDENLCYFLWQGEFR